MKKVLVVSMSLAVSIALFACGSKAQANQQDAQVAELQRQVAELQQQVNQNQQNQQPQQVNQNQQSQQPQQVQANTQVAQTQVSQAQQSNQVQNFGNVPQNNAAVVTGNQVGSITLDQAKQIATTNAGFDVNSVTYIKSLQDYDDYYLKWEIDFVANNVQYEYDISATDGTILKVERKNVVVQGGYVPPVNVGQQPVQGNVGVQGTTQGIDVEQAKSIATQHAGFNVANVSFVKQNYDFDDGIAKWEIEFVVNTNKYEYEISTSNGTILKFKVESIYDD